MERTSNDHHQDMHEQTLLALRTQLSENEKVIQQQESENQRLARQLASAETELAQLKGGLTFRLLDRYHAMVDRLLPLETRRRHLYNRAIMFARVLILDGPHSFYRTIRPPEGMHVAAVEDVIVYQMAKVGSSSVVASLRYIYAQLGLRVQVYHVHSLNYLDELEAGVRMLPNPEERLRIIQSDRALRRLIDQDQQKRWKLISLVRDPVARNIASFFADLDDLMPDWHARLQSGSLSLQQLQDYFLDLKQGIHNTPETWFDTQMLPVFGIDVFAEPFPKDVGYKTYRGSSPASLLLIRLENLSACARTAISEFLGLDTFVLMNWNMGDDKPYADVYRAFRRMPLPRPYVEEMYNTKLARHFYTEQEIEKFTRIWTAANNR